MTKSIDGVVDVVAVAGVDGVAGAFPVIAADDVVVGSGFGTIIAIGTGRVLSILSASVIRPRIFSMSNERAVARIAALFSGVRTEGGGGIGRGSGLAGCGTIG